MAIVNIVFIVNIVTHMRSSQLSRSSPPYVIIALMGFVQDMRAPRRQQGPLGKLVKAQKPCFSWDLLEGIGDSQVEK